MPSFTGVSVVGQQLVYTITQAPQFVYIELAQQPQNVVRRQGYAAIRLQRIASQPHVQLFGQSIWGQGVILRPSYPGTAVNNQLWLIWRFAGIAWNVFYP